MSFIMKSTRVMVSNCCRFEDLKKAGKLHKYLEKKRKKNSNKDHKYLPHSRRTTFGDENENDGKN